MTLAEILTIAQREYEAFQGADDQRAHLQARTGHVYDTFIEPIDLPINDILEGAIIDPAARMVLVGLAGKLYDAIEKRLSDGDGVGWPTLPEPPVEGED